MGGFDVKAKTLPTVSTALLYTAIVLLDELYKEKGPGPWVDDLHDTIVLYLKNRENPPMSPVEEVEHVDAALTAIDALFSVISAKY